MEKNLEGGEGSSSSGLAEAGEVQLEPLVELSQKKGFHCCPMPGKKELEKNERSEAADSLGDTASVRNGDGEFSEEACSHEGWDNGEQQLESSGQVHESGIIEQFVIRDSEEEDEDRNLDGSSQAKEFVYARALLHESLLKEKQVFLSPGFRTVAARAGWDDEALFLATQEDGPALNLSPQEDEHSTNSISDGSPVADARQQHRENRDRKREVRTPQQAITPLSAGRRHRRPRRQSINGCLSEVLPVGDLSRNQEFQEFIQVANSETQDVPNQAQENSSEQLARAPVTETLVEEALAQVAESGVAARGEPKDTVSSNLSVRATREESKEDSSSNLSTREASSSKGGVGTMEDEGNKESEKSACLDQLREELSCAVCLDVCFQPSTTSCGHSFCRSCLKSVLQKCGPRCPKCRQALKGDTWRTCPVNVVLWNTIQILFPQESAAKVKAVQEQEQDDDNEAAARPKSFLVASATARLPAWQSLATVRSATGGQNSRHRPIGNFRRAFQPPALLQSRQAGVSSDEEREETAGDNRREDEMRGDERRSRRRRPSRQEQIDAALASRLQQAELMRSSGREAVTELQRELERYQQQQQAAEQRRTVSAAAANLRAVASMAVRHSPRFRSHH